MSREARFELKTVPEQSKRVMDTEPLGKTCIRTRGRCWDNPFKYVDYDGEFPTIIAGAATSTATQIYAEDKKLNEVNWGTVMCIRQDYIRRDMAKNDNMGEVTNVQ